MEKNCTCKKKRKVRKELNLCENAYTLVDLSTTTVDKMRRGKSMGISVKQSLGSLMAR